MIQQVYLQLLEAFILELMGMLRLIKIDTLSRTDVTFTNLKAGVICPIFEADGADGDVKIDTLLGADVTSTNLAAGVIHRIFEADGDVKIARYKRDNIFLGPHDYEDCSDLEDYDATT